MTITQAITQGTTNSFPSLFKSKCVPQVVLAFKTRKKGEGEGKNYLLHIYYGNNFIPWLKYRLEHNHCTAHFSNFASHFLDQEMFTTNVFIEEAYDCDTTP